MLGSLPNLWGFGTPVSPAQLAQPIKGAQDGQQQDIFSWGLLKSTNHQSVETVWVNSCFNQSLNKYMDGAYATIYCSNKLQFISSCFTTVYSLTIDIKQQSPIEHQKRRLTHAWKDHRRGNLLQSPASKVWSVAPDQTQTAN